MGVLKGKVALLTGGSSGIGRATALALARNGARVVLGNRRAEEGEQTAGLIREGGGEAIFQVTDVSRSADVKSLVGRAVQEFGRLDLAFNNSGTEGVLGPLVSQADGDFDRAFQVNVKGVWLGMKYQIEQMLKQKSGVIINNASIFGLVGGPHFSTYTATKHAVIGLTRAAALELAPQGIRVNAVAPGPIRTEMMQRATGGNEDVFAAMVPMKRVGSPEEIAEAVVWLFSDAASFVTGQTLAVDGGFLAQ